MRFRRRRGFRSWLRRIAAAFAVLAVAVVGGAYLLLESARPQTEGTIELAGPSAPVSILRDRYGIPRIAAQNERDAYFALGYVHAQDRFFQMEFMRRLGAGRLSEVVGSSTLSIDRWMRVLGLYRLAEVSLGRLSPQVVDSLQAYADGVNAYLDSHFGLVSVELAIMLTAPEEWRPADSLVWGRLMGMRLSGNSHAETLRARLSELLPPERVDELWPDIARRRAADDFGARPGGPVLVAAVDLAGGHRAGHRVERLGGGGIAYRFRPPDPRQRPPSRLPRAGAVVPGADRDPGADARRSDRAGRSDDHTRP